MEEPLPADAFQPLELGQRIGVVVDAQADRRIFLGGPDDERGGLLAALVAALGFARLHGGDQPAHERLLGRCLECVRGGGDHVGPGKHVARNRDARAHHVAAPIDAARAGVHRDAAVRVMHVKLAQLGAYIGLDQVIEHRLRRHALAQQPHAAIAPERIR